MLLDSPPRTPRIKPGNLDSLIECLTEMIQAGGPKPEDYATLNRVIRRVGDDLRAGVVSPEIVQGFIGEITKRHFAGTLQASARAKPHGYSGDFESD